MSLRCHLITNVLAKLTRASDCSGNSYSITATSNRDVKLFFTQGRRVVEYPDGTAMADEEAAPAWRDDERAQEDDDEEPEEEEQAEEEEEE